MIIEERHHLAEPHGRPPSSGRHAPRQAARVRRRPARTSLGTWTRPTVRARRLELDVIPTFKTVDTCGAEFAAETPYHYSTYEDTDEVACV